MSRQRRIHVEEVSYHRNGVGGAGFITAIVQDSEHGRMLVTDFDTYNDAERAEEPSNPNVGYTAVVNLDQVVIGNVYGFPFGEHAGGNHWRGDVLGDEYRPYIQEAMKAYWDKALNVTAKVEAEL